MTIDEERIWLRVKVPAEDGTAVMEMTDPVVPENGPASLRSWVLAALEQRAGGATQAADRMVAALRERSWEGDDVLADQLEAWLGGGVVRDLRPLPLDLDELAGILDFAGYSLQRQPLILSFNLNSDFKADLGCYPYITLFAWRNVRPFPSCWVLLRHIRIGRKRPCWIPSHARAGGCNRPGAVTWRFCARPGWRRCRRIRSSSRTL